MRTGLTKQEKTTDIWFDEKNPIIHIRTHIHSILFTASKLFSFFIFLPPFSSYRTFNQLHSVEYLLSILHYVNFYNIYYIFDKKRLII